MSLSAADGAVLIAAAVQAAIRERASNRCISGIAAAVAGQVVTRISTGQAAARQQPAARSKERWRDPAEEANDPAELLASLRAHRRAVRAKKKERRRTAKLAAAGAHVPPTDDVASRPAVEILESLAGAAGSCADLGGGPAAMPAQAPEAPTAPSPPLALSGATPLDTLEMLANHATAAVSVEALPTDDGDSIASFHTLRPPQSDVSSCISLGREASPRNRRGTTSSRPQPYSEHRKR